jgi:hypothetical protein
VSVELAEGLPRKLALRPAMRLALLEPPPAYPEALAVALTDITVITASTGETTDAVLAFAPVMADLEQVAPLAVAAAPCDAPLWIAYPKGGSRVVTDLKRDLVPPVLAPLGYRPVAQVALDPTWSALRFRPADRVGR